MAKSNIVKGLNALKEKDIYSLVLFALFKLHNNPEYATLSELVYTLDKENLFNFLSVFEGVTITVPKISELTNLIDGLYLYSLINLENVPYDEAITQVCKQNTSKEKMLEAYDIICKVVNEKEGY